MTQSWFDIQARADSADVYLYDGIGLFGVSAGEFVNQIRALKGKTINLFINSPGGSVFDGVAIYNALQRHDAPVNVTVDGVAASIASVVAQAGSTRTMAKGSSMMVHEAHGVAVGDLATMAKMVEQLQLASENISNIYAERAGGTAEEWRERMAAETWYDAAGARDAGLADAIVGEKQMAAEYAGRVFNLSNYAHVPEWVPQQPETTTTVASTFGSNTTTFVTIDSATQSSDTEEEITVSDINETALRAALGIDDEGDILATVNSLKAQAQDIATGEKGAENALRRENAQLRQQLLSQESDYGQRILALEDRTRQKEAEYAVDSAIQQGRVAPKDRDLALKLALNDAEGFAKFAANLRVDLNERGAAMDAQMAALEPTKDEMDAAQQVGITREALMAQKAKDQGIALPS